MQQTLGTARPVWCYIGITVQICCRSVGFTQQHCVISELGTARSVKGVMFPNSLVQNAGAIRLGQLLLQLQPPQQGSMQEQRELTQQGQKFKASLQSHVTAKLRPNLPRDLPALLPAELAHLQELLEAGMFPDGQVSIDKPAQLPQPPSSFLQEAIASLSSDLLAKVYASMQPPQQQQQSRYMRNTELRVSFLGVPSVAARICTPRSLLLLRTPVFRYLVLFTRRLQ